MLKEMSEEVRRKEGSDENEGHFDGRVIQRDLRNQHRRISNIRLVRIEVCLVALKAHSSMMNKSLHQRAIKQQRKGRNDASMI